MLNSFYTNIEIFLVNYILQFDIILFAKLVYQKLPYSSKKILDTAICICKFIKNEK